MEISNFGSPGPKKVFFENVCMQYRATKPLTQAEICKWEIILNINRIILYFTYPLHQNF